MACLMNSKELKKWLKKQGCTFDESRGKGGHITVYLGNKITVMPVHGQKDLPTGTVEAIKKQLGLKGIK
jgi:mRNA interferase HicA